MVETNYSKIVDSYLNPKNNEAEAIELKNQLNQIHEEIKYQNGNKNN